MGTVNVLEAAFKTKSVEVVGVVTTDKVYRNNGLGNRFVEKDALEGKDPYSASKVGAEAVIRAWQLISKISKGPAVVSVRAGNVIGGGDWSADRLMPDAIAAFEANESLLIRNPLSTRPWQHVLEPLSGYLLLSQALVEQGPVFNGAWNFGPNDCDVRSVQEVVELLMSYWGSKASWRQDEKSSPYEARSLKLDCSKAKGLLAWHPHWSLEKAIESIVQWQQALRSNGDMLRKMHEQIAFYNQHR
jgi:CDP-glucose 4,6-dehydratase